MEPEVVIGIGDIHSHSPALCKLLDGLDEEYDIFTEKNVLSPHVELVFTGDYIDRGNSGLPVVERLMELDKNANCYQLFGNHELLALGSLGRARNVFLKPGDANLTDYKHSSLHGRNGGDKFVKEFRDHSDYSSYVERMEVIGDIGQWMRSLLPYHVSEQNGNKILFVHAGVPDTLTEEGLESFLARFQDHILAGTEKVGGTQKYIADAIVGDGSIFWDRSFIKEDEDDIVKKLNALDLDFGVVGHTPQPRISNYFNRVFNIDVGMSPKYGENTPEAIVFYRSMD